jgi:hypothetical protein
MTDGNNVWSGSWRDKILSRVRACGFETATAYLAQYPADSYIAAAARLGDDVAALQLEWMQFDEAKNEVDIRQAAKDSLVRELNYQLPNGWRRGAKNDFETASAYADWIVRIEQKRSELKSKAKDVWDSLQGLNPPVGWVPQSPDDRFISEAFRNWNL